MIKRKSLSKLCIVGLAALGFIFSDVGARAAESIPDEFFDVLDGDNSTLVLDWMVEQFRQLKDRRTKEIEEAFKTEGGIAARREKLRRQYRKLAGDLPEPMTPPAEITGVIPMDGYRIEKVAFESRPNHHVTALLYVPDAPGPHPGILLVMGHYQQSKTEKDHQAFGGWLAQLGFVVLCPDPFGQGEYVQLLNEDGKPAVRSSTGEHTWVDMNAMLVGRDSANYEAWDNMRGIDYLYSRPEVDKTRKIGLTGTSGGGTMTTFLMALDDRIGPAAPSCFIHSDFWAVLRGHVADGCQQFRGVLAAGIDHADYAFMHAPEPTLFLMATRDMVTPEMSWPTVREATRLIGGLDCGSRVFGVVESYTTHGMLKPHREAAASWMLRWLKGEDRRVFQDREYKTFSDEELWVTKTGQALTNWENEVSIPDLTLQKARELGSQRRKVWSGDRQAALKGVRQLIGLPDSVPPGEPEPVGQMELQDCVVMSGIMHVTGHPPIPGLLYLPTKPEGQSVAATLWLDSGGKQAAAKHPELMRRVRKGQIVVVPDLRGFGETADTQARIDKLFGIPDLRLSMMGTLMDRPLLGLRVLDAMVALNLLATFEFDGGALRVDPKRIHLVGVGDAVPEALHLAAIDSRIASVALEGGIRSWFEAIEAPLDQTKMRWIVPEALKHYDLTNLEAAIAPRPVTNLTSEGDV